MDREELKETVRLCTLIKDEQNPEKFMRLFEQLNDLLERKERRLVAKLQDLGSQAA